MNAWKYLMNKTTSYRDCLLRETTPVGGQQILITMFLPELLFPMPSTPAGSRVRTLLNMCRLDEKEGRSAGMTAIKAFEKLMEPGYIGSLRLKNRIIKTAAGTGYTSDEGDPTDQQAAFYSAFAKGGVGLVITESCGVEWPRGTHSIQLGFRFHDDSRIPYHSSNGR